MGSDHYCLRWNNHQSNLLGVFSQLLRDESLVDVTLACSEGHSIRAHKVVLSACSSYFQTLFVDHPARHPIVILKDVRFAELSTLVEFMYHGEVNVEHCQLSELLRTAESLKVKGLTDMTNLGPPPVNLQAPTQHGNTSSASTTTTTTTTTCCKMEAPDDLAVLPPEQTEPTELLNKKPSAGSNASLTTLSTNIEGDPMVTATTTCTTTKTTLTTPTSAAPISLVSSDRKSIASDPPQSQQHQFHMQQTQHSEDQSSIKDSPTRLTTSSPHAAGGGGGGSSSIESDTLRAASPTSDMDDDLDESDDEEEEEAAADDYKPSDMRLIAAESSQQRHPHHHESAVNSVVRVSDLGNAIGLVLGRLPSSAQLVAVGGSEPIAGPSNVMPPVQQVPLSLKKEVDWGGGGSADEKSNIESPSDYPRHSLDPSVADVERCFVTTSPASSTRSPRSPQHSSRSSTPATFTLGGPQHPSPGPGAAQLPSSVSIAAAVVGYHQQRHHNLATSLLEAGLVHPALFNAAAAAAAVAAAGGASAGEDLYRCGACMAAFPSIWLLEQHTALQHIGNLAAASTSSSSIDKPFVCEQCGQSYRYRSAYVKHREQNHRARLPADKLFSCDFCGMQFRYLKSFKKHRLNHALERLHGKANSETRIDMICGSGIPSGSKETTTSRGDCAPIENSSDQVSSSNETLTVIDDQPMTTTTDYPRHSYRPDNRGATDDDNDTEENPSTSGQREHIVIDSDPMQLATTSDEEHEEADDQDDTIDSVIKETSKSPAPSVSGVKYAPLTAAGSSLVNVRASTSTGLAATSDLSVAIAGGSAPAASTMATVDAVEAFRSAQQASIINFLRADAAERQRERRFACPFCGKCVRSKENLKLHVRKHTGERPFVCLFCGRAFGGKSDLTRHLRIHTGERPYHCDMCGKCFARADYLSKHLTTHINAPR